MSMSGQNCVYRQANRGQSDLECKNQLMDFSPIERMFNFEVPGTYSDHKMKEKTTPV